MASLDELARARERGRQQLAEAEVGVEEAERPYLAAVAKAERLREALRLIDRSMEAGSRAHVIHRAIEEAGVETTADPIMIVSSRIGPPDIFELTAIGPEGTPLYVHKPDRPGRRGGKVYARPPRSGDVERCAAYKARSELRKGLPSIPPGLNDRDERKRVWRVHEEFKRETREEFGPNPHDTLPQPINGAEGRLVRWEDRGKGDFGAGSGARKPQPPPEGGHWRWLKVREQEELTT